MTLRIENGWLPGEGHHHIHIDAGLITAVGADLPSPPGAQILNAQFMAVVPGLVNGHSHAAMSLLRGYGDDMPLMDWLQNRIWPAEARLTETDIYWGCRLACLEMIRSGTVAFKDMFWNFPAVARAVEESGLRASVGSAFIDVAGPDQAAECIRMAEQNFEQATDYSRRVAFSLAPHAPHTVSEKSLRWVAAFSEKQGVLVQIHLSETQHEVEQCLQKHGVRPTMLLDRLGLLTPLVLLAHGVHLNAAELDLIAARGATLVTNPVSNMKLAVGGVFPYTEAARRGIPVALGTDGAASNNSLDLFQDMKIFTLLQKHALQDASALPAAETWSIATGARAPLLGQSGRIAVGEKADLLLLRQTDPELTPAHDFISNLVYAASGQVVDTVIVNGRILMQNRFIDGEEATRTEAAARARTLPSV